MREAGLAGHFPDLPWPEETGLPPSRAMELARARRVEEDGSTEGALGVESMVPSMRKGKLWLI